MAIYRRFHTAGATWFFTLTAEGRRPLLVGPDSMHWIRRAAAEVRGRYPFELIAWVVLPDHLHALVNLPDSDCDYAKRISIFKRIVSKRLASRTTAPLCNSMRTRRENGVWQRRFWEHMVRNQVDLQRHLDYIHFNPVRHGLAGNATGWPHSSIHRYVESGMVAKDWAAKVGDERERSFGE